MKTICAFVFLLVNVAAFAAQPPTIDGTRVGDQDLYGTALSIQNTGTGFGNALSGDSVDVAGSELNQVFATIQNDRLYVLLTGNLEDNFNKLEIFFDTQPGGHNQLVGANLPGGVDGFCCGGTGALQQMNGLRFDEGFEADFYLTVNNGVEFVEAFDPVPGPVPFWAVSAHYSDLRSDAPADRQNVAAGMQLAPHGLPNVLRPPFANFSDPPYIPFADLGDTDDNIGPQLPGLAAGELIDRDYALDPAGGHCANDLGIGCVAVELAFVLDVDAADPFNVFNHRNMDNRIDLQLAMDNSNTAGVEFFPSTAGDPEAVDTGIEFSIPISELGSPTGELRMVAFINGLAHDFASNQFIGDGILGPNLGGAPGDFSLIDLGKIPGEQFVTIVAEPSCWATALIVLLFLPMRALRPSVA